MRTDTGYSGAATPLTTAGVRAGLRVAVILKTNDAALWTIPKIDELRRRRHEVVAILPAGPGRLKTMLIQRGVEVVDSPFNFRFRPTPAFFTGLWRLRRLIRRLGSDVVHYHLYASALAARLSTLGMRVRRVHMVVGPLYLEASLTRRIERWLWPLDHVTVCGSEHASGLYGEFTCPAERRPVVPLGIDVTRFSPPWLADDNDAGAAVAPPANGQGISPSVLATETRAKARADLGVDGDKFVAIMVAYAYAPKRLVHKGRGIKGHDILLAAWQTFHARHPRSHLLLVGGGWLAAGQKYREDLIHRFHVDTNRSVTWVESVPDVRPYYIAADVSVSPSLSELHGAVREASAMGVPSIASDVGGLPEVVDETCGWVVPRDDVAALETALDAAYREFRTGSLAARGRRAREFAAHYFDERITAGRLADIIERSAGWSARP